jgi:hypothetical protein
MKPRSARDDVDNDSRKGKGDGEDEMWGTRWNEGGPHSAETRNDDN